MKKHFWLMRLFGVWCLLSSLWYFLSVKGVITDPKNFNPQVALVAILEILLMLLGACLLGYAIAWNLRGETINSQNEKLDVQREENSSLVQAGEEYKSQLEGWHKKHHHDLMAQQQKLTDLMAAKEKLQKIRIELETSLTEARNDSREVKSRLQPIENEIGTLRYRNRQLEFQVKEAEESGAKLKVEIENLIAEQKAKGNVFDHPFFTPIEINYKYDLTKINGNRPII